MTLPVKEPDLSMVLSADRFAPRVARQALSAIDSPSPDLRDAILLLASSLVTQACRATVESESSSLAPDRVATDFDASEMIELRAWMPRAVVRVEVGARGEMMPVGGTREEPIDFERELLTALADRWGSEPRGDGTLVWFEIDRVASAPAGTAPAL